LRPLTDNSDVAKAVAVAEIDRRERRDEDKECRPGTDPAGCELSAIKGLARTSVTSREADSGRRRFQEILRMREPHTRLCRSINRS